MTRVHGRGDRKLHALRLAQPRPLAADRKHLGQDAAGVAGSTHAIVEHPRVVTNQSILTMKTPVIGLMIEFFLQTRFAATVSGSLRPRSP